MWTEADGDRVEERVNQSRATRAWAAIRQLARQEGVPVSLRHVCAACAGAVSARGASVSISRGEGLREPVCTVGQGIDELEELQFTIGEGPSIEAFEQQVPVLVEDLTSADSKRRWPVFTEAPDRFGVRAMFSFPMQAGAARAGVLAVYRARDGMLSTGELLDALTFAEAARVLTMNTGEGFVPALHDGYDERRAEVHQAAGMISVQLGTSVEDALVRLRTYAYTQSRRLTHVASDVVARRLRFTLEDPGAVRRDATGPGTEAEA